MLFCCISRKRGIMPHNCNMTGITRNVALAAVLLLLLILPVSCEKRTAVSKPDGGFSVLVYITGMMAGSPPYEMLAAGALEFAAKNPGVTVKVFEAGFNQAEWEEQLTSLVSGGEYDLVLGSNPSLPEICVNVGNKFPNQKFVITDAVLEGNPQIATYLYNQYEQALFLGYLAGLITVSSMPHANAAKRVGFIAAQEYPLLDRHIAPGFLAGARLADPAIELDFRVVGNWFDAGKAAELASGMIDAGVDVFTSIAGGAAQGMIKTAASRGAYVVCFNTSEYERAPGVIAGCGLMKQRELAMEILAAFRQGGIEYGASRTVGVKEGYIDFIGDDSGYRDFLPDSLRGQFDAFMQDLRAGNIDFTVPPL